MIVRKSMSSTQTMWKGAHIFTFAFINIHKNPTIHCRKIPVKTVCHHEQATALERKQGKRKTAKQNKNL